MKNTAMKKLAVVAALSCACAVAWAENVLYVHPVDPSDTESKADAFSTQNNNFSDEITASLSVAIWVKDVRQGHNEEKFIAGVEGCWRLSILSGKLGFRTGSGSAETNNYVVNDGNWHFLVGTFNHDSENPANSFQRLYVDGNLVGQLETTISALTTPAKAFSICSPAENMKNAWGKRNFFGYFAELSVWNRALSDSEVSVLYSRRVGGNESGLVAYWPLTGMPGTTEAADFTFANLAKTTGVPKLVRNQSGARIDIVADDGFTKPYARFVASPEWCTEHSYEQKESATGRSWDDPLTNLVETAAAAERFERILCSPGTHKISSSISPLVENFYLGSYDPATCEPCPETAIIDAQELCCHFISTNVTSHQSGFTIENLTFVNGREASGGSMLFIQRIGKINNCIFHDNAATSGWGGAYYAYFAPGTVVSNCQFYGNSATFGGGAVYTQHNTFSASDCQRFVDCVFTNNTAGTYRGGGIAAEKKIELENCLFADNKVTGSDTYGGHAYVGNNSIMNGCVFTGTCRAYEGDCLYLVDASVVVSNCVFGGMDAQGTRGVFTLKNNTTTAQFIDCVITNNSYAGSHLIRPNNSNTLVVRQCLIVGNPSNKMIIPNQSGTRRFENCTIDQTVVTPTSPSAVATNTFVNCIMPNATITSSDNYCNILSNCLVEVEQGGSYDSGVITGNPKFKDAENGDYTLEANSPCRDRGLTLDWMTNGSTDLLGNPRLVDTRGVAFSPAALPDLGCYEIQEREPSGFMLFFR